MKTDAQQRTLYRYTGHQNTAKNFIRCSFALDSSVVVGGSEDGSVYAWEREPTSTAVDSSGTSTVAASTSIVPPNGTSNGTSSGASYYAARTNGNGHASTQAPAPAAGAAVNVRPYAVLETDGVQAHGAAFDVKERAGLMVCAWDDGYVGVWEADEGSDD